MKQSNAKNHSREKTPVKKAVTAAHLHLRRKSADVALQYKFHSANDANEDLLFALAININGTEAHELFGGEGSRHVLLFFTAGNSNRSGRKLGVFEMGVGSDASLKLSLLAFTVSMEQTVLDSTTAVLFACLCK